MSILKKLNGLIEDDYSKNRAVNMAYRAAILDAIDLVKNEDATSKRKMFDDFYKWYDSLTTAESDEHSLTSAIETYFFKQ